MPKNPCVDWELYWVISVIVLGVAGLALSGLAVWHYIQSEQRQRNGVPVALAAFALQYGLARILTFDAIRRELLLPTILMFWVAIALIIAIWVGVKAHSKAGYRIAFAGVFTLAAYFLLTARAVLAH